MVDPAFGLVVGESPAYAVGWDSGGVLHVGRAAATPYGEQKKVLWVIRSGFKLPVSLKGGNVRTGRELYFEIGNSAPTPTPSLDPKHSGASTEGTDWPQFPSYLDIPAAGCFFVEATWPGGHWRLEFPAGD